MFKVAHPHHKICTAQKKEDYDCHFYLVFGTPLNLSKHAFFLGYISRNKITEVMVCFVLKVERNALTFI